MYGAAGWGLSIWLNATYWIPIGILVGAGFGLYLVFARTLVREDKTHQPTKDPSPTGSESHPVSTSDDAARRSRPASDDRGETA